MPFDLVCAFPGTSVDNIWQQYVAEYLNPQVWKYPKSERWKPVTVSPAEFEVSSWGRVRKANDSALVTPLRHRQRSRDNQYAQIYLGKTLRHPFALHRLVAFAFFGPPEPGQEVCHWNDIGVDNRVENLRWGTRKENCSDAQFTGHNRKRVRAETVARHSGSWDCDMSCTPQSQAMNEFKLDLWEANGRKPGHVTEACWHVLEAHLQIIADEAEACRRAA